MEKFASLDRKSPSSVECTMTPDLVVGGGWWGEDSHDHGD